MRKFLINSSAKFYTTGEQRIYPVTHIQELMDIDLTRIPYNGRRVPCGRLGYDMENAAVLVGIPTMAVKACNIHCNLQNNSKDEKFYYFR